MHRNVAIIIWKLLEVIPDTEKELIISLKKYGCGLWNKAPETMGYSELWIPVQHILIKFIPFIDEPWKIKAQNIFVG